MPGPEKSQRLEGEEIRNTPQMETSQTDQEPTSKMEDLMGFKIKVAERAGTALKNLFRLDQNLEGGACSRQDCSTFTQGGEELPDCTRRNITYGQIS